MVGPSSWPLAGAPPSANDPSEWLRRIERNSAAAVYWLKILVAAVVVLVILTALLFVP
jgi:hypothetical protein